MPNQHHIQRLDGTPPPAGNGSTGWRVRWFDGEGRRRVRTFADSKCGGTAEALQAAIEFRDGALAQASETREARIRASFVPALRPEERGKLRARMIDADCHAYNRHIRLRVATGETEPRQVYFPFRRYGSPRLAFQAAIRLRDRLARLPIPQRKELLA